MITFSPLKKGDTIGIAAASSPFDRTKFMKGIHAIEKMGFNCHYRHDIFDQSRYLAGTDERRAAEFVELITDRKIAAVMFARGGYGSQRIIPMLDKELLGKNPKPVIGFSDLTPLLAFLRQDCGFPTFYGPVVTQIGTSKSELITSSLARVLLSKPPFGALPSEECRVLKTGEASAKLVGGCLSMINSSIGTGYDLNTDESILFIEEINEKVYVMDRMLTQLVNSGKLKGVRGIIFGSLLPPSEEPYDPEAMIADVLKNFDGPVISGFPAGHIDNFVTLPLGGHAELKAPTRERPSLNLV